MKYLASFLYNRFLFTEIFLLKFQNKSRKFGQYLNNSRENIHFTVWYQPFENTLPLHSYLFGNFFVIVKGCSWHSAIQPTRICYRKKSVLFTFGDVLKFCPLRVLKSFIQQRFSPWCKVKWLKKFLKFRPLAYLEPCKTSMMELFCKCR